MYKVTPSASSIHFLRAAAKAGSCVMVDASTLPYRNALRAAIVQEQLALLETRLAVARWVNGSSVAAALPNAVVPDAAPPCRAAFYAREQDRFFAWIERGGMWDSDPAPENIDAASSTDLP